MLNGSCLISFPCNLDKSLSNAYNQLNRGNNVDKDPLGRHSLIYDKYQRGYLRGKGGDTDEARIETRNGKIIHQYAENTAKLSKKNNNEYFAGLLYEYFDGVENSDTNKDNKSAKEFLEQFDLSDLGGIDEVKNLIESGKIEDVVLLDTQQYVNLNEHLVKTVQKFHQFSCVVNKNGNLTICVTNTSNKIKTEDLKRFLKTLNQDLIDSSNVKKESLVFKGLQNRIKTAFGDVFSTDYLMVQLRYNDKLLSILPKGEKRLEVLKQSLLTDNHNGYKEISRVADFNSYTMDSRLDELFIYSDSYQSQLAIGNVDGRPDTDLLDWMIKSHDSEKNMFNHHLDRDGNPRSNALAFIIQKNKYKPIIKDNKQVYKRLDNRDHDRLFSSAEIGDFKALVDRTIEKIKEVGSFATAINFPKMIGGGTYRPTYLTEEQARYLQNQIKENFGIEYTIVNKDQGDAYYLVSNTTYENEDTIDNYAAERKLAIKLNYEPVSLVTITSANEALAEEAYKNIDFDSYSYAKLEEEYNRDTVFSSATKLFLKKLTADEFLKAVERACEYVVPYSDTVYIDNFTKNRFEKDFLSLIIDDIVYRKLDQEAKARNLYTIENHSLRGYESENKEVSRLYDIIMSYRGGEFTGIVENIDRIKYDSDLKITLLKVIGLRDFVSYFKNYFISCQQVLLNSAAIMDRNNPEKQRLAAEFSPAIEKYFNVILNSCDMEMTMAGIKARVGYDHVNVLDEDTNQDEEDLTDVEEEDAEYSVQDPESGDTSEGYLDDNLTKLFIENMPAIIKSKLSKIPKKESIQDGLKTKVKYIVDRDTGLQTVDYYNQDQLYSILFQLCHDATNSQEVYFTVVERLRAIENEEVGNVYNEGHMASSAVRDILMSFLEVFNTVEDWENIYSAIGGRSLNKYYDSTSSSKDSKASAKILNKINTKTSFRDIIAAKLDDERLSENLIFEKVLRSNDIENKTDDESDTNSRYDNNDAALADSTMDDSENGSEVQITRDNSIGIKLDKYEELLKLNERLAELKPYIDPKTGRQAKISNSKDWRKAMVDGGVVTIVTKMCTMMGLDVTEGEVLQALVKTPKKIGTEVSYNNNLTTLKRFLTSAINSMSSIKDQKYSGNKQIGALTVIENEFGTDYGKETNTSTTLRDFFKVLETKYSVDQNLKKEYESLKKAINTFFPKAITNQVEAFNAAIHKETKREFSYYDLNNIRRLINKYLDDGNSVNINGLEYNYNNKTYLIKKINNLFETKRSGLRLDSKAVEKLINLYTYINKIHLFKDEYMSYCYHNGKIYQSFSPINYIERNFQQMHLVGKEIIRTDNELSGNDAVRDFIEREYFENQFIGCNGMISQFIGTKRVRAQGGYVEKKAISSIDAETFPIINWFTDMYNSPNLIDKFVINTYLGHDNVDYPKLKKVGLLKANLCTFFGSFMNEAVRIGDEIHFDPKGSNEFANYIIPLSADKATIKMISAPVYSSNPFRNSEGHLKQRNYRIDSRFSSIVFQELMRIKVLYRYNKNREEYNLNHTEQLEKRMNYDFDLENGKIPFNNLSKKNSHGGCFFFMAELNNLLFNINKSQEETNSMENLSDLDKAIVNFFRDFIYSEDAMDQQNNLKYMNITFWNMLDEKMREILDSGFEDFVKWNNLDDVDSNEFKYIYDTLKDFTKKEFFNRNAITNDNKDQNKEYNTFLNMLKFYYANSKYANMMLYQVLDTDLAFYENWTDTQKRSAQHVSGGISMNTTAIDSNGHLIFNQNDLEKHVIIIDDLESDPKDDSTQFSETNHILGLMEITYEQKLANLREAIPDENSLDYKIASALLKAEYNEFKKAHKKTNASDGQGLTAISYVKKELAGMNQLTPKKELLLNGLRDIVTNLEFDGDKLKNKGQVIRKLLHILKKYEGEYFETVKQFTYTQIKLPTDFKDLEKDIAFTTVQTTPFQAKNAEANLLDVLDKIISDDITSLKILKRMEECAIDAILYASNIKVGNIGIVRTKGYYGDDAVEQIFKGADKAKKTYSKVNMLGKTYEATLPQFDKNSEKYKENRNFVVHIPLKNIVRQQETPNHWLKQKRGMGVQIQKLTFDRIEDDAVYNMISFDEEGNEVVGNQVYGRELMSMFEEGFARLVDININNMLGKYGISRHEVNDIINNNPVNIDTKVKINKFISDVIADKQKYNKNITYDLQQAVRLDSTGKPYIPFNDMTNFNLISKAFVSIIRDMVIAVETNGGQLVQKTDAFKFSSKQAVYDEGLKIEFNEDGSIKYYEAAIPITDGHLVELRNFVCRSNGSVKEKYLKTTTDENGKTIYLDELDPEKLPEGMTRFISYRVPTEGYYSIIPCKMKIITHPISGGNIVLPKKITTITGSDFDIDKIFFMRPALKFDKKTGKIEYIVPSGTIDEMNRDQVNNLILNVLLSTVTDTAFAGSQVEPGGFAMLELIHDAMQECVAKNGDVYDYIKELNHPSDTSERKKAEFSISICDPLTQMQIHQRNFVGKQEIGIFANALQTHSYLIHYNITINNKMYDNEYKLFEFAEGKDIKVFGMDLSAEKLAFDRKFDRCGFRITDNLRIFISAAVDSIKNPLLNDFGMNMFVINFGITMLRLGFSLQDMLTIIQQPVFKELSHIADIRKEELLAMGITGNPNPVKTISMLLERVVKNTSMNVDSINLDFEDMFRHVTSGVTFKEMQSKAILSNLDSTSAESSDVIDFKNQVALLKFAGYIAQISVETMSVTDLIKLDGTSGNRFKNGIALLTSVYKNKQYIEKLRRNSPDLIFNTTLSNVFDPKAKKHSPKLIKILSELDNMTSLFYRSVNPFLQTELFDVVDTFSANQNEVLYPDKIIPLYSIMAEYHWWKEYFESHTLPNGFIELPFGGQCKTRKEFIDYFTKGFVIDIANLLPQLRSLLPNNSFVDSLHSEFNKISGGVNMLTLAIQNSYTDNMYKQRLIDGWSELFNYEKGENHFDLVLGNKKVTPKEIGEALFTFCIIKNGFNMGKRSFLHLYSSIQKKNNKAYIDFLNANRSRGTYTQQDIDNIVMLYLRHNKKDTPVLTSTYLNKLVQENLVYFYSDEHNNVYRINASEPILGLVINYGGVLFQYNRKKRAYFQTCSLGSYGICKEVALGVSGNISVIYSNNAANQKFKPLSTYVGNTAEAVHNLEVVDMKGEDNRYSFLKDNVVSDETIQQVEKDTNDSNIC